MNGKSNEAGSLLPTLVICYLNLTRETLELGLFESSSLYVIVAEEMFVATFLEKGGARRFSFTLYLPEGLDV